jgi:hypothetical protein
MHILVAIADYFDAEGDSSKPFFCYESATEESAGGARKFDDRNRYSAW